MVLILKEGGNTSKIYYYKLDNDAIIEEFKSIGVAEDVILQILSIVTYLVQGYLYNGTGDDVRGMYYNTGKPIIDSMWNAYRVEALLICEDVYEGLYYPYVTTGDLYTKINYTLKAATLEDPNSVEETKPLIDIILKYTTEITKEEFWNMCELPITSLPNQ